MLSAHETTVVVQEVERLLDVAQVDGPPVDARKLAKAYATVQQVAGTAGERGTTTWQGKKGVIRHKADRPEREQFAVAHELAELLAAEQGWQAASQEMEQLANRFARELLAPTRWFAADARAEKYDLLRLKQVYHTASAELLALRFLDVLGGPAIVTIYDNGKKTKRLANRDLVVFAVSELERVCREQVDRTGKPAEREGTANGQGLKISCWPIWEEQADGSVWRREIMLTTLDWWG